MNARSRRAAAVMTTFFCVVAGIGSRTQGAITPAQRKELAAIRTELVHIRIPVKSDQIDEAEKQTSEAETRLEAVANDASLKKTDSHVVPLRKLITARREAIAKARAKEEKSAQKKGKGGSEQTEKKGTGFTAQVAPILVKHCLDCHGADAKGGLRLDTFAGMRRGGKRGPLLVEGDAANSLIIAKLVISGEGRMPKGGEALSEADCRKIAVWINRGAKFDGEDEQTPLDKLGTAASTTAKPKAAMKVSVARPTGTETVSFIQDVAPFMVERCLRCHSGNEPKGGLSLETFEHLLTGGKSGPVIKPGDLEKSRMWQLAGEQRPFKMPPGDALITARHRNSLRTWIMEGATYDGGDPARPLRSLVRTDAEKRAAELAKMTPQQLREERQSRSEQLWRRALPKQEFQRVEDDAFLVYGNVPVERLKEFARWAGGGIQSLQKYFDEPATPVFKGGLAIFVLKDRLSYEEFSLVIEKREPTSVIRGHAVVTPDLKNVYVVVQDLSDESDGKSPSARENLQEHLAEAFLLRSEKKLPDWLVFGSGRLLAAPNHSEMLTPEKWRQMYRLAGSLEKPDDVFADGSFSPPAIPNVGAAVEVFLLEKRGKPAFVRFVKSLERGTSQAEAFREVYGIDQRGIAQEFLAKAAEASQRASK